MDKSEVIDFSALERELHRAIEADRKYQRENDAKFRAIHQKVSTYEEFRDIVQASHLKPLDKKDKHDAARKQPWNSIAAGNNKQKPATLHTEQSLQGEFDPSTAYEFGRDWRRFGGSSGEKYSHLIRLGGEKLRDLFRAEVGFGLLGEFLVVLSRCLKPEDEEAVMALLEGFSQTGRFSLNISLLSKEERGACQHLLYRLQEIQQHTDNRDPTEVTERLQCLMVKYGYRSDSDF
ncbi:coiled-coil domain-containing protein 103 [Trichomycterus rosablanca]|uniref:coiled-coil domain-containing protein 103 n=1 Tax=Trichomycterus rosablanca TaxID=2290929 RepID=UPI002F356B1B